MRIKLDHRVPIDHLFDPDDIRAFGFRLLDCFLHFNRNLRRIRCAGAKYDLKTRSHKLDGTHKVDDPLLPGDSANEEQVRLVRIDPMTFERVG